MKTPNGYGTENEETAFLRRIAVPDRANAKRKQKKRLTVVGATIGLIAASAVVGYTAMRQSSLNETMPTEQLNAKGKSLAQYASDESLYPSLKELDTNGDETVSQTEFLHYLHDHYKADTAKVQEANIPQDIKDNLISKLEENLNSDGDCALRAFKRMRASHIVLNVKNLHTLHYTMDEFCETEPLQITQELLDQYTPAPILSPMEAPVAPPLMPPTAPPFEHPTEAPTAPLTETDKAWQPMEPENPTTEPPHQDEDATEAPTDVFQPPVEEPKPWNPIDPTTEPADEPDQPNSGEEPVAPANPTTPEEPEQTTEAPVYPTNDGPGPMDSVAPDEKPSSGEDIKDIIEKLGGYDEEKLNHQGALGPVFPAEPEQTAEAPFDPIRDGPGPIDLVLPDESAKPSGGEDITHIIEKLGGYDDEKPNDQGAFDSVLPDEPTRTTEAPFSSNDGPGPIDTVFPGEAEQTTEAPFYPTNDGPGPIDSVFPDEPEQTTEAPFYPTNDVLGPVDPVVPDEPENLSGGEGITDIIEDLGGYDADKQTAGGDATYMTKEEFHQKLVERFSKEDKFLDDIIKDADAAYANLSSQVARLDDCIEQAANKFGYYGVYEQAPHFANAIDWVANVCMKQGN